MDKKNIKKIDNRGISLIEIIIVLAIISIIGAVTFLSTTVATDKQVNSCGLKIGSSLEQTRNLTMGKQSGYIVLSQAPGDSVYVQMYVDGQPYGDLVAVGKPGLTVDITYDGVAGTTTLSSVSSVQIEFDRGNGSVKTTGGAAPVVNIAVTNGRRTMNVKIDKFTGRVETSLS